MKNFAKNDYYIQLCVLIAGLFSILIGIILGYGAFLFYFIVGIPQLISFCIKAFRHTKKSLSYIVYGIFIIPVWVSWMVILGFSNNNDITIFFGYILIAAAFYSPFLAIFYVYDAYELYQSEKQRP